MWNKTEYLDERYLLLALLAAMCLHMGGIYAWHLMPSTEVMDIPVHALSIKLGDGDPLTPEEQIPLQPENDNKNNVESAISKIAHDADPAQQARNNAVMNTMEKAMAGEQNSASKAFDKALAVPGSEASGEAAHKPAIARQFVRTNAGQSASAKGTGSILGNSSAKEAEMMSRYEQLISLWIEKFKKYPDEARSQGMQGETVIRIRIDRQGNIRYYILERSTGFEVLDRAAIDMVKLANPVPAVPNDYPQGDLIEFLIPVNFHLQ